MFSSHMHVSGRETVISIGVLKGKREFEVPMVLSSAFWNFCSDFIVWESVRASQEVGNVNLS